MSLVSKFAVVLLGAASIPANAQSSTWPQLPKQGFITGRAATQADVGAHNAVFAAEVGGTVIGKPLHITIPQFAYHNAEGKKIPVVVVQAEEAQGKQLIGAREFGGQEIVGFLAEFELLGNTSPKPVAP